MLETFVIGARVRQQTPTQVKFELVRRLRGIRAFKTPQALATQIARDVSETQKVLDSKEVEVLQSKQCLPLRRRSRIAMLPYVRCDDQ